MDSTPAEGENQIVENAEPAKEGDEAADAEDVSKMDENVFKQNTDIIETTAEQEF